MKKTFLLVCAFAIYVGTVLAQYPAVSFFDGTQVTEDVEALKNGTNGWNKAATDASNATGQLAVIVSQTNQIIDVNGVKYVITNAPGSAGDVLVFDPASTTAQFVAQSTPFQKFTATIEAVDGTATVSHASGSLVRIYCTNDTTLAFDSTGYPTSGVSRVAVELWAGTNSIAFDSTTINTNDFKPTVSTNDWTSLFFRRSGTNSWTGRY